jgi:hypothetical protein
MALVSIQEDRFIVIEVENNIDLQDAYKSTGFRIYISI